MHGNRPSTSSIGDDDCATLANVQCAPDLLGGTSEVRTSRRHASPERPLSRRPWLPLLFFVLTTTFSFVGNVGAFEVQPPQARFKPPTYNDEGIGNIVFSSTTDGKSGRKVQLQRMVYDQNTDRLIVGAVNHLYDVQTSLAEIKEDVTIGPADCDKKLCDVYVKALVIDPSDHTLIECSSAKEGICRRRVLGNVSNVVDEAQREMVAYGPDGTATALLTKVCRFDSHTYDCSKGFDSKALFVGTTPMQRDDTFYLVAGYYGDQKGHFKLIDLSINFGGLYLGFNNQKYHMFNKIDYVFSFEDEKYVYFIMKQSYNKFGITSMLARFCKSDSYFYSYTEIPLVCQSASGQRLDYVQDAFIANPQYNLAEELHARSIDNLTLIFAVFSNRYNLSDQDDAPVSGLCVFDMKNIGERFLMAQRSCNAGNGTRGFNYISMGTQPCRPTQLEEVECGSDVNPFVNGSNFPAVSTASLVRQNDFFTSVFVHGAYDANVAFIGTSTGVLHKTLIYNMTTSKIFKSIQLTSDRTPILQDKIFVDKDSTAPTLFVMSKFAIHKVNVFHCERGNSCVSCLRQENPFCGWCMRSNTCTRARECPSDKSYRQFIKYSDANSCPSITDIAPSQQYVAVSRNLTISAQNIVDGPELKCRFSIESLQRLERRAERIADGKFRCATPTFSSLLAAGIHSPNTSSFSSVLSLVNGDAVLTSSNFTFFDCQQHASCHECAASAFPCAWCIKNHKCVANAEDGCRGDQMVVSKILGSASRMGPTSCPLFDTRNHSNFYIGSGKNRQISVKASNLEESSMRHFKCNFSHGPYVLKTVNAVRRDNDIECLDVKFDNMEQWQRSPSQDATVSIDLSILWAKSDKKSVPGRELADYRALDNPYDIKVVVYMCERLATNCGNCLTLPRQYECGWCEQSNRCTFRAACEANWLSIQSPNVRCKNPRITNFWPRKGPLSGGTRLNITGINLGLNASDVQVNVANQRCELVPSEYRQAESVMCVTKGVTMYQEGRVVVSINGGERSAEYANVAEMGFHFVNPEINSFRPVRGPVSGGTDVTVFGRNLDSGRDAVVKIGQVNCNVRERTEHQLVCRTERAERPGQKETLSLTVDGAVFSLTNKISFEFLENPVVARVERNATIVSGGILVDVLGKDLFLLQRPHMVVQYEDDFFLGPICTDIRKDSMVCRTPEIRVRPHTVLSADQPLLLRYNFSLDADLPRSDYFPMQFDSDEWKLKVFPDPYIGDIGKVQTAQAGADLVIRGANLTLAAQRRDINVTIGGSECKVTALSSETLTCQLGNDIEERFANDDELDVFVTVGKKFKNVGIVASSNGLTSSGYLIPAVATACASVILVFILLILYRRKNNSHNRQLQSLKNQMTSIEMKVAQECKEAFHELQTNLNAIAGSLPDGTSFIPFLSYHDYTARILFPHSFSNHPVLRELEVDQERAQQVENGLRQLHNLVQNKTFLLSFVRTIDENKYLLQKDRAYVGSLLMVILQERMDYCTDILKQLLKDLIRRNLEARFQPKILFRRAESVAERMLSVWFSFLMYRYLTGTAGEQLYQFYWATKQQTEKGPQDCITLEAKYSLSEEKLLRSTVQSRELIIFVVTDSSVCDTQVTVLDCDSISQVKEKCIDAKYRTIPYSGRPSAADIDLEWRMPNGNHKILLDLDHSSTHENGHWRYNTLAHYKVDSKAMLALVSRQANSSSYNLSLLSDRSDKSSGSYHNSPTLTRPFGTNSSNKDTMRTYHLVRQQGEQDSQEKMMSEIYLTRLLHMKGILQRFIENLFEVIFSTSNRSIRLPACVKYMFDFLDDQAREHGIIDEDVCHAWKSNALPLRFWVNLIKNPDFIFDIAKPTKIEGSLNVVAQTLMDACSTQELHLTKDSPSSKLLFANDIDKYKTLVHNFYEDVSKLPRIPEGDMNSFLVQESQTHQRNFVVYTSALNEMYVYVAQNRDMIFEELSRNEYALREQLPERFQKMLETMEVVPDNSLLNNGSLDNYNSKSRLMSGSNSRFY